MKGIVCHFTKADKTTLASARIANWLCDRYGLGLMDREDLDQVQDYDLAICVSSPSGFASPKLREQIGETCARATRYVFAQNDYMTSQAGQIGTWFKKLGKDRNQRYVWSTIPRALKNPWDTYINWNVLPWKPYDYPQHPFVRGLSYYGACRKGRIPYFEKFLNSNLYPVTISTTTRGATKFKAICPDAVCEKPFEDQKSIGRYQLVLYAEDDYSHRNYSSPATRFYECLGSQVPQVFDASCIGTFDRAGYNIRPYVVRTQKEVFEELTRSEEIRHEQTQVWFKDYKAELEVVVDAAMEEVTK